MKRITVLSIVAIVWTMSTADARRAISGEAAAPKKVAGKWLGTFVAPGMKLRLAFEIQETKEGGYSAVFHSIDQGVMNVPMSSVTLNGDSLRIQLKSAFAFEGKLQPDGNTIDGNWIQGGSNPLVIKRVDTIPSLNRPQTPKKPYPYREEAVAYKNPWAAGVSIAGTLTMPEGKGPFPAVLLIAGSGPADRDETVFGHKPFLVLADHLTRKGLAVLRADKRGIGGSTGTYGTDELSEIASDALAGVEYLKGRTEVDAKRIGLLGHSEGGAVVSLVAAQTRDVAYLVLLASPGISGYDLMVMQDGTEAMAGGRTAEDAEVIRGFSRRYYDIVCRAKDAAEIERETKALYATLTAKEKELLDWPNLHGSLSLAWGLAPGSREKLKFDVRPVLRKVRCPVLALNGGKDSQIPPAENLGAIEKELKAGANRDFTVRELPGLNHFFQTCSTGSGAEYLKIEETMSPLVLKTVSDWITSHTATAAKGVQ